MSQIVVILDNVRSAENVGSIARTSEAAGVAKILTCGITPRPRSANDLRPAYIIARTERALAKSALGAENKLTWEHFDTAELAMESCRKQGLDIYAIESQRNGSINLLEFRPPKPGFAVIFGAETTGLSEPVCKQANAVLEIPMHGHKLSLNVAVCVGITLYSLR